VRGGQQLQYRLKNHFGLTEYIVIPKPDYVKALRFKASRSHSISVGMFSMLPAIEFDDQVFFDTDKINDVGWKWVLASKFKAAEVTVFRCPQRRRSASVADLRSFRASASTPHPYPLPACGEREDRVTRASWPVQSVRIRVTRANLQQFIRPSPRTGTAGIPRSWVAGRNTAPTVPDS